MCWEEDRSGGNSVGNQRCGDVKLDVGVIFNGYSAISVGRIPDCGLFGVQSGAVGPFVHSLAPSLLCDPG